MPQAGMALINLDGGGNFVFQFFPATVSTTDRANWEPQDTTIGVKPLFYANREPRSIEFPELYLDTTTTNASLTPQIKALQSLFEETANGTPPKLLAAWGDRHERCVLQELTVEEIFFHREGHPIRARIRMTLQQVQGDSSEATSVNVT